MPLPTLVSLYFSSRLLHTQTLAYQSSYSENRQLVIYFSPFTLYHDILPGFLGAVDERGLGIGILG